MKEYLLILRNQSYEKMRFSDEEYDRVMSDFRKWNKDLENEGLLIGWGKLSDEVGNTVRIKKKQIYFDGPFSESKEVVLGYYIIKAKNLEEASKVASTCPVLSHHKGSIEIRPLESRKVIN